MANIHRLDLTIDATLTMWFGMEEQRNPPPGAAAKSVDNGDQGGMALGAWRCYA